MILDIKKESNYIYMMFVDFLKSIDMSTCNYNNYNKKITFNIFPIEYVTFSILYEKRISIQLENYLSYWICQEETDCLDVLNIYINGDTYLENKKEILNYIFREIMRHYYFIIYSTVTYGKYNFDVTYGKYNFDNDTFVRNFLGDINDIIRCGKLQEMNDMFENGL